MSALQGSVTVLGRVLLATIFFMAAVGNKIPRFSQVAKVMEDVGVPAPQFMLIGAIGAISFGGLGLLTASRARKIESVSGLINIVMMPMWIFSGVFFSYERFPSVIQPFIKALPLTALNDALRATILEGAPLATQAGRLLILLLWGGISFLLALRWFRWT